MGRRAGHLALGIGKAAGATLTLIPEEFRERPVRLANVTDILAGAIIKRLSRGREDGVVVLAEGLAEVMDAGDLAKLASVSRDEHGHVELADLDLGRTLKEEILKRLAPYGVVPPIRLKDLGYELRSADPIPFDMEYCRDLGCCAADYLMTSGTGAMVSRCASVAGLTAESFREQFAPVAAHERDYDFFQAGGGMDRYARSGRLDAQAP